MGKAARNRGLRRIAEQATVGYPELVTKSVARSLRRQARELRRRGVGWRGTARVVE